jgi:branched-subunit amino acid transport protein
MEKNSYLILLLGMGAVTYIPRWLPMFFLSGKKLPQWFIDWLDFIPVAILSALLIPELVISGTPRHLDIFQAKMMVGIPTFLFALKTRSLAGTVVVGMGLFWLAERFMQ